MAFQSSGPRSTGRSWSQSRPAATQAARGEPRADGNLEPPRAPAMQSPTGASHRSNRAQGKWWIYTHPTLVGAAPLRAVTDGYWGPQMVSGVGVIARLTGGIRDLNLVLIYVSFIEGGGAAVHVKHRFHSPVHGLRLGAGVGGWKREGAAQASYALHLPQMLHAGSSIRRAPKLSLRMVATSQTASKYRPVSRTVREEVKGARAPKGIKNTWTALNYRYK